MHVNRIARPIPSAAEHAPLSVLNRTGRGIRTMIVCSCEWQPKKVSQTGSGRCNAHIAHRRSKGMPRFDYAGVVFGEGPWMGLTWDEWYADKANRPLGPYTGSVNPW